MKSLLLVLFFFGSLTAAAQQLVYTPKNPAFGGNPYNSSWLMQSAEAQNQFKEEEGAGFGQQSELERFTSNLNSQLLNRISRSMFTNEFGADGLSPGTYTYGSLAVDIYESSEGLVVNILDTETGEQTQVIIPN